MLNYTLGLDLGVNSVGWAAIEFSETGEFKNVLGMGSRVFEAGLNDLERGKGESRNLARRLQRQIRKQGLRKSRRLTKIFNVLQRIGLLPEGENTTIFNMLDARLLNIYAKKEDIPVQERRRLSHVLPYYLRAKGLSEKLPHYELGRALYHLAHRRGFKSSRKTDVKNDKEVGVVLDGINELRLDMQGCQTLGEYFSKLDPEKVRIRQRWTARDMFEQEFDAICEKQKEFYPELLNVEFIKQLRRCFFFQRPLKSQKHLIGRCPFELKKKRIAKYRLEYQKFRILQTINHLRVQMPDGTISTLEPELREKLQKVLEVTGKLGIKDAKKLLNLKSNCRFTIENGDKDFKLEGDKTTEKMIKIFGDKWYLMPESDQLQAITDIVSIYNDDCLFKRAKTYWHLSDNEASKMKETVLEDDYASLSKEAILKLMPHLEEGLSYAESVQKAYPNTLKTKVYDQLPALNKYEYGDMRNPLVCRTLSQMRTIVNSIVQKWGKPEKIRIELARDLKNSAKQRKQILDENKQREKRSEAIRNQLINEKGFTNPSSDDILKVKLLDECKGICPYTGKGISYESLFSGEWDIEHIIPLSRSLDNSFANKTLCHHDFNRNIKKNRTPYETLHGRVEYDEMISRVKKWGNSKKLERFEMNNDELSLFLDNFSSRQLNDTRYASLEAMDYLGVLFGGQVVSEEVKGNKRKIESVTGGITALFRSALGLNGILNELGEDKKSRDDHRHHALDALVIAMVSPSHTKYISDIIGRYSDKHGLNRLSFKDEHLRVGEDFKGKVKEASDKIIVSHSVSHRMRGELHKGTNYAKINDNVAHEPISLEMLNEKDIQTIVSDREKNAIINKLKSLGYGLHECAKAFKSGQNIPYIHRENDVPIPIKKVRIKTTANTIKVGTGPHARDVMNGENHHIEIIEKVDKKGKVCWEGVVVSLLDAIWRHRRKQPVIQRDHGPNNKFLFSLMKGDFITLEMEPGKPEIFIVRTITSLSKVVVVSIYDARTIKVINPSQRKPDFYREKKTRKITIHPLGDIRWAND